MENRIRSIFLSLLVSLTFLSAAIASADSGADSDADKNTVENSSGNSARIVDEQELESVIQPDITRSTFDESNIKSADFEAIFNVGIISIEDFGTNTALVLKLNYHISDSFFVGTEWVNSKGAETSFEVLSGGAPLLSNDEREFNTYLLTLGYNALPGEAFLTDDLTYNTSFYVVGGLGKTEFGGDDRFTVSIGAGYRILLGNFFSMYTDFRDHIFSADIFGTEKSTHNLQFTIGAGFYF
jgi:outer membrane beta-barrel protein